MQFVPNFDQSCGEKTFGRVSDKQFPTQTEHVFPKLGQHRTEQILLTVVESSIKYQFKLVNSKYIEKLDFVQLCETQIEGI